MSTTIPALNSVNDILDTDLCLITHSNGESYKISGADINKRNQAVIAPTATPKVLTGAPLKTGNIVRVYWTEAVTSANGTTALSLSYNSVSYTVKVPRNGALENFLPFDLGGGLYEYFQAHTTLELLYDGTQFIIIGNPVVISGSDYTIYADGLQRVNTVATNNKGMVTSHAVANKLYNNDYLRVIQSESVNFSINANTGIPIEVTFNIPSGYKGVGYVGLNTSGPGGAVNWYSYAAGNIRGKTGTQTINIYFRNYTDSIQSGTATVDLLCVRTA